jgi:hypothetical protein
VRTTSPKLAPRPHPPSAPKLAVAPVAAPEQAATAKFKVTIRPWADVFVDGTRKATQVPSVELALAPGPHTLKLVHPDCQPFERAITLQAGENPEFRQLLSPKPARLRILAIPADASVMIDSVFSGTADETRLKPISVPIEDQQKNREVTLRVFKQGFEDWHRQITLSANQDKDLSVKLIPR